MLIQFFYNANIDILELSLYSNIRGCFEISGKLSQRETLLHLCFFEWVYQESTQRQRARHLGKAISPLFAAQKASRPKSPLLSLSHSRVQPNYLWQWLNRSVLCCEGPTLFNLNVAGHSGSGCCVNSAGPWCGGSGVREQGPRVMESPGSWEQWAFRM